MAMKRRTKTVLVVALLGLVLYASLLGARLLEYQFSINRAVSEGDLVAVLVLLPLTGTRGPEDGIGVTPLGYAAMIGDMTIVKTLLLLGADPDGPSDHERRPVVIAAQSKRRAVARYLLDRGATYDVDVAVALGDVDYVRKALESSSFSANYQYFTGERALTIAIENNDVEMAHLLLENGADPEKSGFADRTMLEWPRSLGFNEMADLIESYLAKKKAGLETETPK